MPEGGQADRSVLQTFHHAGFVDIGHQLGKHNDPTVPAAGFVGTEFVPFHYPVFADFKL